jgi:large subunit ribosomal protein L25
MLNILLMKLLEIKCSRRAKVGKKESNKLRKQGNIPCVLYGGEENIHFFAPENDFRHLVNTPNVYLLKLQIEDKVYDAVLQDLQFHPVTDRVLHIDFYRVYKDRPVSIAIPVQLNGVPEGVKQGGKLALETRRLKVKALPGDLPDILEVDVTRLGLGKSIKVEGLKIPGIQLLDSPNTVVASVKLTRAARGMAPSEEEAAAEEAGAEGQETAGEAGGEGAGAEGGQES